MIKSYLYYLCIILVLSFTTEIFPETERTVTASSEVAQMHQSHKMGFRLRWRFSKGVKLYEDGKYNDAKIVFNRIVEDHPNFLQAHEYLGLIALRQKDFRKAKIEAEIILKILPTSAKGHLVKAYLSWREGRKSMALHHLKKAREYSRETKQKEDIELHIKTFHMSKIAEPEVVKAQQTPAVDTLKVEQESKTGDLVVPSEYEILEIKPYIAIFPFEDTGTKSEETKLGESVVEMLITALINTGQFRVMERTQLSKIMEEQALGLTGVVDQETAVDVGKIVGVDAVVVGSVSYLGSMIELDARLVNATNGEAITAVSASSKGEVFLRDEINKMANTLGYSAVKIPISATEQDTLLEKGE